MSNKLNKSKYNPWWYSPRYKWYKPWYNNWCSSYNSKWYSPYNKWYSPYYNEYSPYYKWYYPYNKWYSSYNLYSPWYSKRYSPWYYRKYRPWFKKWYNSPCYYKRYSPWYGRRFNKVYTECQVKMDMFKEFLTSLPKNRSELVNDLDVDDIVLSPSYRDVDELSVRSVSPLCGSIEDLRSISTDSSIPLSRAVTDSEIDYGRYHRFRNRSYSEPFDNLKAAVDAFPPGYLSSLSSYTSEVTEKALKRERERYYKNEELRLKMAKFFDEECSVFGPDDPGLIELEDTLRSMDLKSLEADLAK